MNCPECGLQAAGGAACIKCGTPLTQLRMAPSAEELAGKGVVPGWSLGMWLRRLLAAFVVLSAVSFIGEVALFHTVQVLSRGDKPVFIEALIVWPYWSAKTYGFDLAAWCFAVGLVVLFAAWTYRMNANLHQRRVEGMRFRPVWAAAWFFVPIANLWKPYQVISEIWRASANPMDWQPDAVPTFFFRWWTLSVGAFLLDTFYIRIEGSVLTEQIMAVINLVTWPLDGIVAVLTARLVREVQRLQATSLDQTVTVVFE